MRRRRWLPRLNGMTPIVRVIVLVMGLSALAWFLPPLIIWITDNW